MRLLPSALLATLLSLSAFAPASAQSPDVRYLAANCANCHGTDGRAAGGASSGRAAGVPVDERRDGESAEPAETATV